MFLAAGVLLLLSFISFHPGDPSWNHVGGNLATHNLIGRFGAHLSDLTLQAFGLGAFVFPALFFALGWKWVRSEATGAPIIKLLGSAMLVVSACGAAALIPEWRLFEKTILAGGTAGFLIADSLKHALNLAGAAVVLATSLVLSLYLVSTFTLATVERGFSPAILFFARIRDRWNRFLERRRENGLERMERKREAAEMRLAEKEAKRRALPRDEEVEEPVAAPEVSVSIVEAVDPALTSRARKRTPPPVSETLPWDDPHDQPQTTPAQPTAAAPPVIDEIPICVLTEKPAVDKANLFEFPFSVQPKPTGPKLPTIYRLPSTDLLNEIPQRSAFDEQELKNVAAAIKVKFEEFNVLGGRTCAWVCRRNRSSLSAFPGR